MMVAERRKRRGRGVRSRRKPGYYSISAVAEMLSIHQQTIRAYEREGLISPKRSAGNTRMFSEDDIRRLEEIIYLTQELGINLAGVEMILKLQKKIDKMQHEIEKLFSRLQGDLVQSRNAYAAKARSTAEAIRKMKKNSSKSALPEAQNRIALPPGEDDEK